jgi:hypothetical protein
MPEEKSAVDRYQSAFLTLKWLLGKAAQRFTWPVGVTFCALAEVAHVNIINLTTRLIRQEMIFIPKRLMTIYRSKDELTWQKTLF